MNTSLTNSSFINKVAKVEVAGIKERYLWNHYVERAIAFDMYHTYDYHMMDKQGEPLLFVYEEENKFIALPLIKRKIENTPYFDCTTVYGYTGALTNINSLDFTGSFFLKFSTALREFLLKENVVSCFTILHPLLNQKKIFEFIGSGRLHTIGRTVAINLRISLEEQRLGYRKPIRTKINQLRRKGYQVYIADSYQQLKEFSAIYRENMIKVGASEKYLFTSDYFEDFMRATDYHPELLLVCYDNKVVAGAMVSISKDIMQLHLAGTRNEFLKESPMKLIFDEASLLGRAREAQFLHLGSGVGGKEDSLFHFKTGFSNNLFDFTTWQYIVNENIYKQLVNEKIERGLDPNSSYFPLYRSL